MSIEVGFFVEMESGSRCRGNWTGNEPGLAPVRALVNRMDIFSRDLICNVSFGGSICRVWPEWMHRVDFVFKSIQRLTLQSTGWPEIWFDVGQYPQGENYGTIETFRLETKTKKQ